jgi:regulator of protease activity HflC (stomatin/prohibitin superfamily)
VNISYVNLKTENKMKKLTYGVALLLILSATFMQSCTRVNPTEAGFLISNSGNYRGIDSLPLLTGFEWYMPGFSHIVTIPTTLQHEVWTDTKTEGQDGDQAITIACMGGAGFRVDVGLNYHVMANKASHIYLKWKNDDLSVITNQYIKNVVRGSMQDVSGHITVDSILTNLPAFEHAASALISERLLVDGFYVDVFNIVSQPRPTNPQLAASINAKVTAKQDAETSIMQLQTSVAEANKKIAVARGDSASAVITAAGEAEAIRLKQREITPVYVDYIKWINAGEDVPRVPETQLGGNTPVIFSGKK